MKGRLRALKAVGWVAVAVVLAWCVYRATADLTAAGAGKSLRFDAGYLALSVAVLLVYHMMFTGGVALILRALGVRCGFAEAFVLIFATNLGKYVPGGVWPVVGRYAIANKVGISGTRAVLSAVLENALSVVAGIAVAVIALGSRFTQVLGVPPWLVAAVGLAPIALLHPAVFTPAVRWGLRLLGSDAEVPRIPFRTLIGLVGYYAVSWCVVGVAFGLFARAVVAGPAGSLAGYVGSYAAASVGGLLVLFAPSGIGVREGIAAALLAPVLGAGVAAALALSARLWSTAAELVLSGIAVIVAVRRGLAVKVDRDAGGAS